MQMTFQAVCSLVRVNYNKAHKCVQQHLLRELNEEYPVISIKGRIRNNQEEPFKFIVQVWISNLLFWGNGKRKSNLALLTD